jgi:hypothetical protein
MSEKSKEAQGAAALLGQIDRHPRPRVSEAAPPAPAAATVEAAKAKKPAVCPPLPECEPTKIKRKGANGDEGRYGKTYIGNFHKGLPHDGFGEVDKAAYKKLLKILDTRTGFETIPLSGGRLMVNPQAGLATDVEGPNPKTLKILRAPRVDSAETAAEAVELYWMALLRDVRFTDVATNADVAAAAAEISGLQDFTGPRQGGQVTPQTIFRGCFHGDLDGPFVSQFLLHDIFYGSLTISQQQQTVQAGIDYLTSFPTWLAIQNGQAPAGGPAIAPARHIQTMRDLAHYVHVDALYEAYLNACLILLGHGAPLDPGNPYLPPKPDSATQIGFGTFGGPHVLSLVCEVATRALKAMWWQKWYVHRRLRPEAYGGLVHVKLEGVGSQTKNYPIHPQVLGSQALARTHSAHGSYLLPMAFPEGSPTHPSYGAGHATVAGACVTVLKAFFDDLAPLPSSIPVSVPNAAGGGLVPYTGPGGGLTVGGELNKVAANIAIGRNMAGVHWRSDYTESLRLGEQVALHILRRQRKDYHEKDWSFSLCTFDGRRVKVDRTGVRDQDGKRVEVD